MAIDILQEARGVHALLNQDQIWVDIQRNRHDVTEMSVRYKTNVVGFLERCAGSLAALYGTGETLAIYSASAPIVIGVGANGDAVESSNSVYMGPTPGSMADDCIQRELEESARHRAADPVGWIRDTYLMRRLISDVEQGLGGVDD